MPIRRSAAEKLLIHVFVWLLGYSKLLLGCGYTVYEMIFKDYLTV